MTVQLVIFNTTCVITDPEKFAQHQLISLAKKFVGQEKSSQLDAMIALPLPALRERLLPGNSPANEIEQQLLQEFNHEMRSYYRNTPELKEADGTSRTFSILRQNDIQVALYSPFDRIVIQPVLDRMGWVGNRLIDTCVAYDELSDHFPHPDMILRAMTLSGVDNLQQVFTVGNNSVDIQQGRQAGCKGVVAIGSEGNYLSLKGERQPTHLIEEVSEVLDILHFGGYTQFSPSTQRLLSKGLVTFN